MSQPDNPVLNVSKIEDDIARRNFQALADYFRTQNQLLDFQFFELSFTAAESGKKVAHGLNYAPLDILVTHLTGAGKVTFKYASFDAQNIVLDVDGACRVRFFVGTCAKVTTALQNATGDAQAFTSGVT